MSALDQVFIRAYSKETGKVRFVESESDSTHENISDEHGHLMRQDSAHQIDSPHAAARPPADTDPPRQFDDPYANGSLYHEQSFATSENDTESVEPEPNQEESEVPVAPTSTDHRQPIEAVVVEEPQSLPNDPMIEPDATYLPLPSSVVMVSAGFMEQPAVESTADLPEAKPAPEPNTDLGDQQEESPRVFGRIDGAHQTKMPAPHFRASQESRDDNSKVVNHISPYSDQTGNLEADIFSQYRPSPKTATKVPARNWIIDQPIEKPRIFQAVNTPVAETPPNEKEESAEFEAEWEVSGIEWPSVCDKVWENKELFQPIARRVLESAELGDKIIAVASGRRGEGRTTMALCLARQLSDLGAKVLLVDADFKNPQLASSLQFNIEHGWERAIDNDSPVAESAVVSIDESLTVLPLKSNQSISSQIDDRRVAQLLKETAESFDLLLLDVGTIDEVDTSIIDATVVIQDVRNTTKDEVDQLVRQLQSEQVNPIGIAENFTEG